MFSLPGGKGGDEVCNLIIFILNRLTSMPTEEKRIQEKASLVNVNDSFKKIIVVKDVMNVSRDEEGITTMSIYDFLLKENSLEL